MNSGSESPNPDEWQGRTVNLLEAKRIDVTINT